MKVRLSPDRLLIIPVLVSMSTPTNFSALIVCRAVIFPPCSPESSVYEFTVISPSLMIFYAFIISPATSCVPLKDWPQIVCVSANCLALSTIVT